MEHVNGWCFRGIYRVVYGRMIYMSLARVFHLKSLVMVMPGYLIFWADKRLCFALT